MNRLTPRQLFAVGIVCIAAGWWCLRSPASPFVPEKPKDRPVLKFIARVAKFGLWIALAAEKQPVEPDARQAIARFDENGNRVLDHEGGW